MKRGIAGTILGAVSALLLLSLSDVKYGALFLVLFTFSGFIEIETKSKGWSIALTSVYSIVCFFILSCIPSVFSGFLHTFPEFYFICLNVLCILVVFGFVYMISGRIRLSVVISSGFLLVLALASQIVFSFRGRELLFSDLFSIGTAANVASEYSFTLTRFIVIGVSLWGGLAFAFFSLPKIPVFRRRFSCPITAVSMVAVLVILQILTSPIHTYSWLQDGTHRSGFYLNFYKSITDTFIASPDGYSTGSLASLEGDYPSAGELSEDLPNVIVIMNESFSDLSVLGDGELKTSIPVTPFIDSLEENTVKGTVLSSVFGGNTANSEFEFLTSHSMAYLPSGSVPYQQYIFDEIYALPHLMKSLGYSTVATHPYHANGWSRDTLYPKLGFDESVFLDGYTDPELCRAYVSDKEMYDFVLDRLSAEDGPLFLFGITMQNHGGYNYTGDDFENTVSLEGYSTDYPLAEQFLTLMNISDGAVEYLLCEIEKSGEDTVVLFFGDHLPKLDDGFYEELHGGDFVTLEERMLMYTVPFFLWANFDIPEYEIEGGGISYLPLHLLKAAGIDLSPYYAFLSDMEKAIPALSAFGYYSKEADAFIEIEDAVGEEAEWLRKYSYFQYNNLFDKRNRSVYFFGY